MGTASVTGGAGSLQGITMDGVESLSARAYSVDHGLIAADGRLLIELPAAETMAEDETALAE